MILCENRIFGGSYQEGAAIVIDISSNFREAKLTNNCLQEELVFMMKELVGNGGDIEFLHFDRSFIHMWG
eukprot:scaffold29426_cov148-Skeletonema_menzelii.AAC.3